MNEAGKFELSIILDRYAVAMLELAEKHDILDIVNGDLALIKEIVQSNSELREFIEHPLISNKDKKDALKQIFKEHISEYTMNLIKLLADKNRLFILQYLWECYNKLLCRKRNIDTAEVITAVPIDKHTVNRIKEKLENMFNKQIKIEPRVDEEIIAGMIVKIDDKVIDGSIRTKFDNMKKQLC